jgi:hypothetical protein
MHIVKSIEKCGGSNGKPSLKVSIAGCGEEQRDDKTAHAALPAYKLDRMR